jgi:hypothetical protein
MGFVVQPRAFTPVLLVKLIRLTALLQKPPGDGWKEERQNLAAQRSIFNPFFNSNPAIPAQ